jgi:hypothetical protein
MGSHSMSIVHRVNLADPLSIIAAATLYNTYSTYRIGNEYKMSENLGLYCLTTGVLVAESEGVK